MDRSVADRDRSVRSPPSRSFSHSPVRSFECGGADRQKQSYFSLLINMMNSLLRYQKDTQGKILLSQEEMRNSHFHLHLNPSDDAVIRSIQSLKLQAREQQ